MRSSRITLSWPKKQTNKQKTLYWRNDVNYRKTGNHTEQRSCSKLVDSWETVYRKVHVRSTRPNTACSEAGFETDSSIRLCAHQCFCHCEETSHWSSLKKNVLQLTVLEYSRPWPSHNSRTWGMRQLVRWRWQSGSRWRIPLLSSFLPVQDRTMLSIQGGPAQICLISPRYTQRFISWTILGTIR